MSGSKPSVLVVDDDQEVRNLLRDVLALHDLDATVVATGAEALESVAERRFDAILLDVVLPDGRGPDFMPGIRELDAHVPILLMTGCGSLDEAVRAVLGGAEDYFLKPFANQEVVDRVKAAMSPRAARGHGDVREAPPVEERPLLELVGASEAISRVCSQVEQVAGTDFSVVVSGETGTGKGLFSLALHSRSRRRNGPFVTVDCGSIPMELMESELFGHVQGAFTGASADKKGLLELPHDGTLFLDEIGNLALPLQAKLLRVLQEREFCRVGAAAHIRMDARVIAATNVNLEKMVAAGKFRRDLYHRLCEFLLEIPPLRERREDIVFLSKRFLEETNEELGKRVEGFSEKALETMLAHAWHGNVRELRNVVRRAVLLAERSIEPEHLRCLSRAGSLPEDGGEVSLFALGKDFKLHVAVQESAKKVEWAIISEVLRMSGGNKAKAARILGIDYKTLHVKIRNHESASPDRNRK